MSHSSEIKAEKVRPLVVFYINGVIRKIHTAPYPAVIEGKTDKPLLQNLYICARIHFDGSLQSHDDGALPKGENHGRPSRRPT